jgi:hypothetical protein
MFRDTCWCNCAMDLDSLVLLLHFVEMVVYPGW